MLWIRRRAGGIVSAIEVSRDGETGSGAGVADEVEDFGVAVQRLGGPVF